MKAERGSGSGGSGPKIDRFQNTGERAGPGSERTGPDSGRCGPGSGRRKPGSERLGPGSDVPWLCKLGPGLDIQGPVRPEPASVRPGPRLRRA